MLAATRDARRIIIRHNKVYLPHYNRGQSRRIATSFSETTTEGIARKLAERQPCFALSPADVRVLLAPKQFYDNLLGMIRRARKRVFLSSLYIGSEEGELIDTLSTALRSNPSLQVEILLDLNRSTRPESPSTAEALSPLLAEFPDRVHISLFRSPRLKGMMSKIVPPRFNEGWGTWHAKIYGVDDEVMISGANLNKSYFTNRQDRYVHFGSHPEFAHYCHSYLRAASTFSYQLQFSSTSKYSLQWPDPDVHPHHIEPKAARAFREFQSSYTQSRTQTALADARSEDRVLIFPVLQAGQFNIREEEVCVGFLFDEVHKEAERRGPRQPGPLIDLTSGYFGLYGPYKDLILRSDFGCRILAASPKANGFYGSKGVSGRIPEGYTYLEQRFMRAVHAAGRDAPVATAVPGSVEDAAKGVQLSEWERDGWTYHAKGLWLSPTPDSPPVLTLLGSTNLNSRSANLDTELSFILLSSSHALRRQLHDEVEGLRRYARPWQGEHRKVRIGTKMLVNFVGGML
ncbi:hypothetical protein GLOTRDRAFT_71652 [Gloeophyllum trabeum ATCC 11539]|uniref:CDP-diacylglycerol--glycerol-3-phosphate 3-phosphatidyltransferase n=1 Tax=Gloeophyllum trabeum (strain ATCC 11539 / FP-39264 / Madison 617) TaxID=670483 RepID=S7RWP8_GLOTA|nr:uncharacterized protein GLOTRDRAFT_71652 [Gloeophyllum trabeum ATCC 11539]EPQ57779.1 hypothetical protein GLOTRDRAFT_71652 [Gloeophyllum trabeum ATCC 11539]